MLSQSKGHQPLQPLGALVANHNITGANPTQVQTNQSSEQPSQRRAIAAGRNGQVGNGRKGPLVSLFKNSRQENALVLS